MAYKQKLAGKEKTAAMLLSLPEDVASKILECFSESEIQDISKSMMNLGKVSSNIIETMFLEFMQEISTTGVLVGGKEQVTKILSKALTNDQINQIMQDMKSPGGKTLWEKLSHINPQVLAKNLKDEHPQTIAVILSRLDPTHSSKILSLLPESFSVDVIIRMVRMEPIRQEVIEDIEKNLKEKFVINVENRSYEDNYELLACIFNEMDDTTETKLFSKLADKHIDIAKNIKSFMFDFEDFAELDLKSVQIIVQEVDKSKLAMALKGSSIEFRDIFLKSMSERGARLVLDDMRNLGSVKLSDVEEARSYIVNIAKEIESTGSINLTKRLEIEERLVE